MWVSVRMSARTCGVCMCARANLEKPAGNDRLIEGAEEPMYLCVCFCALCAHIRACAYTCVRACVRACSRMRVIVWYVSPQRQAAAGTRRWRER
jgi:hypothetical protein